MGAPFGCEGREISHNCPCVLVGRKLSQERRKAHWIAQVRVASSTSSRSAALIVRSLSPSPRPKARPPPRP
jgi:hypothetical protein